MHVQWDINSLIPQRIGLGIATIKAGGKIVLTVHCVPTVFLRTRHSGPSLGIFGNLIRDRSASKPTRSAEKNCTVCVAKPLNAVLPMQKNFTVFDMQGKATRAPVCPRTGVYDSCDAKHQENGPFA